MTDPSKAKGAPCGHSFCGQNWIDTGQTDCILVDDLLAALAGEVMPDGCVRGCRRKQSSDYAHSLRCVIVTGAIAKARGGA